MPLLPLPLGSFYRSNLTHLQGRTLPLKSEVMWHGKSETVLFEIHHRVMNQWGNLYLPKNNLTCLLTANGSGKLKIKYAKEIFLLLWVEGK